jgi:hypothetical protein
VLAPAPEEDEEERFEAVVVVVVYIFRPVEPKARLPKGIGCPAAPTGDVELMPYEGKASVWPILLCTDVPNPSGCQCLTTRSSSLAARSSTTAPRIKCRPVWRGLRPRCNRVMSVHNLYHIFGLASPLFCPKTRLYLAQRADYLSD